MPQRAFVCPDPFMWDADENGELSNEVPVDACLNCSLTRADRGCVWDYADLTRRLERDQVKSYTPSKFLGCDEELFLKLNNDYAIDPAKVTRKSAGNAAHEKQETDHPDIVSERLIGRSLLVNGEPKLVTVKPDKVYRKMGVIQDDKTWSYLPVGEPEAPKGQVKPIDPQYFPVAQLSIGAWAIAAPEQIPPRDDRPPLPVPEPVKVTRGQVVFRDSKNQIRHEVQLQPKAQLEEWMARRIEALDRVYAGEEPAYGEGFQINTTYCSTCPVNPLCPVEKPKKVYKKGKK